jgi:hypothetical protein
LAQNKYPSELVAERDLRARHARSIELIAPDRSRCGKTQNGDKPRRFAATQPTTS